MSDWNFGPYHRPSRDPMRIQHPGNVSPFEHHLRLHRPLLFRWLTCAGFRVSTMWEMESEENKVWISVSTFTCSTDEWNRKYLKPQTLSISPSKTHSEPLWPAWRCRARVINHSLFGPGFIVRNCPTPAPDGNARRPRGLCSVCWSPAHMCCGRWCSGQYRPDFDGHLSLIWKSHVAFKIWKVKSMNRLSVIMWLDRYLAVIFKVGVIDF